tara:strand:- start:209 stop:475 length:267 start_codon:yes stop_codon:yes gene_type:complete
MKFYLLAAQSIFLSSCMTNDFNNDLDAYDLGISETTVSGYDSAIRGECLQISHGGPGVGIFPPQNTIGKEYFDCIERKQEKELNNLED